MSRSTLRFIVAAALWGAAMLGALHVHRAQTGWSHIVCGPWGCGPPAEALLACHAAWLLILTPIVGQLLKSLPSSAIRLVANSAVMLGVTGLIGVGIWQYFTWWKPASEWARDYAVQRYFFSLVCLIDFPIAQLLLSGVALRIGSIVKSRRELAKSAVDRSLPSNGVPNAPPEA